MHQTLNRNLRTQFEKNERLMLSSPCHITRHLYTPITRVLEDGGGKQTLP